MFIKIDYKSNRILSTTIDSIMKDAEGFADNPHYTWTDKKLDYEKLENGYSAFYKIETDEIYYKVYTEPEAAVLSETDEAILNTNLNVEYLVALQELGV